MERKSIKGNSTIQMPWGELELLLMESRTILPGESIKNITLVHPRQVVFMLDKKLDSTPDGRNKVEIPEGE